MMSSVMSKDECKNSLNIFLKRSNFIKVILWLFFFLQNVGPLHISIKTLSCPSYPVSPSCGVGPATSQSPEKEGRILKVEGRHDFCISKNCAELAFSEKWVDLAIDSTNFLFTLFPPAILLKRGEDFIRDLKPIWFKSWCLDQWDIFWGDKNLASGVSEG